jgi:hypothetical protein
MEEKLFEITYKRAEATTKMYIVLTIDGDAEIVSEYAIEYLRKRYFVAKILGYVEVKRPAIMLEDWDDILPQLRNAVLQELKARGLITINDRGVLFWAGA